jgi:hypothetical protein
MKICRNGLMHRIKNFRTGLRKTTSRYGKKSRQRLTRYMREWTPNKNLTSQINNVEKNIIEQFSPITNLVLDHDEQIGELQKAVGLRPKH